MKGIEKTFWIIVVVGILLAAVTFMRDVDENGVPTDKLPNVQLP